MNIVITGASKGMGKAMAERFAAANHQLYICARSLEDLQRTADAIMNEHPASVVHFKNADLSQKTGIEDFVNWFKAFNVPADILINNAGTFLPGSIHNEADGTLEKMMETNLFSAYHITRGLLPDMINQRNGHIFNICSVASIAAYANGGSYSISKYAMAGFSKNLREELKKFNIKVTAIYPGAVYTDSWKAMGYPKERFIDVADISTLVYTIAQLSPAACVEELIIRPLAGDI